MTLRVLPLPLLLAACGAAAPAARTRTAPDLGPVDGGIAWFLRDDYLAQSASWRDGLVVEGPRGGPVERSFTRMAGGFRLAGLWFRQNVDLTVDGKGAQAQQVRYVWDPSGAYVLTDSPGQSIVLVGGTRPGSRTRPGPSWRWPRC